MKIQNANFKTQKLLICLIGIAVLSMSCAQKKEKPLEIIKVTRGSISASIPATGIVLPRNRLEIKPPVAGRVESVLVEEGKSVSKGQILAWLSSQERATMIDAARAKGPEELKRWEDIYKPTPIIAPIKGFIIQRKVEPGQSFGINDIVLVMADHLIVKAQIDETDIGRIKLGQKTEIALDAYPETKVAGEVSHIAYESKVINNVTIYEVDVAPGGVPEFFRSGMSATVNFSQNEKGEALIVPAKAVKKRGKVSYVFKVTDKDKRPETIQVETGLEGGENVEIISGLSEGDSIVIPSGKLLQEFSRRRGGPIQINPFGGRRQN